jgi:hypothetical protein
MWEEGVKVFLDRFMLKTIELRAFFRYNILRCIIIPKFYNLGVHYVKEL